MKYAKVQKVYPENARQLLTTRQLNHVLGLQFMRLTISIYIIYFYVSVFCLLQIFLSLFIICFCGTYYCTYWDI